MGRIIGGLGSPHAPSIGALILTTEAIVSDKPEKPQAQPQGGMGGGDMGGMDF